MKYDFVAPLILCADLISRMTNSYFARIIFCYFADTKQRNKWKMLIIMFYRVSQLLIKIITCCTVSFFFFTRKKKNIKNNMKNHKYYCYISSAIHFYLSDIFPNFWRGLNFSDDNFRNILRGLHFANGKFRNISNIPLNFTEKAKIRKI